MLREVNGTLFAPNNFKQYREVASNTGIVPIATLEELFPHADAAWWAVLRIWNSVIQWTPQNFNALTSSATKLLYYSIHQEPAISSSQVLLIKEHQLDDLPSPMFGWCLGCSDPHQFFSNRFFHVLLLRLAFMFPLASKHLPPSSSLCGLKRRCLVWRNGISWKSVSGVSTIVEIVDHNRWAIALVSKMSSEAAETCSSVIRMILDLQQQLCGVVSTCECLISPSLLDRYPFDALPDTDLFVMHA